jgi:hypothetical protein
MMTPRSYYKLPTSYPRIPKRKKTLPVEPLPVAPDSLATLAFLRLDVPMRTRTPPSLERQLRRA